MINPNDLVFSGSLQLTKREYFAAQAMQGLLSADHKWIRTEYAREAIACADALINALNENKGEK